MRPLTVTRMIPPTEGGWCADRCPFYSEGSVSDYCAVDRNESGCMRPGPDCPWFEPAGGKEAADAAKS
jgi:hypothetical protein